MTTDSAALEWLKLVKSRQYGHGSELVYAIRGPDNVCRAQRILRECVQEGVLFRCRYAPTKEQQFFGSGGTLELDPVHAFEAYHYAPGPNL